MREFETRGALYGGDGRRKYVNDAERARLLAALAHVDPLDRTLCLTLIHTGCRISEALCLTAASVDLDACTIAFQSLKKRGRFVVREVPVPTSFVRQLDRVHRLRKLQRATGPGAEDYLWARGRIGGWRMIKGAMDDAGIAGAQACPKGLRHGFGMHAVQCGVPLNLVQKWMGHERMETTAIYADAIGPEERRIAERMWR